VWATWEAHSKTVHHLGVTICVHKYQLSVCICHLRNAANLQLRSSWDSP